MRKRRKPEFRIYRTDGAYDRFWGWENVSRKLRCYMESSMTATFRLYHRVNGESIELAKWEWKPRTSDQDWEGMQLIVPRGIPRQIWNDLMAVLKTFKGIKQE